MPRAASTNRRQENKAGGRAKPQFRILPSNHCIYSRWPECLMLNRRPYRIRSQETGWGWAWLARCGVARFGRCCSTACLTLRGAWLGVHANGLLS